MSISKGLILELEHEAMSTRKMLQNLPETNLTWKPHEKSMSIGDLAYHTANMVSWINYTINGTELDFAAGGYTKPAITSKQQILDEFEKNLVTAKAVLETVTDEQLAVSWTLRNGDHIIFTLPRKAVLRNMIYNHIVHHRGQLSVYLRMLNIPVPGMYGPSADDKV